MNRINEFTRETKRAAIERQGGVCAFCGVTLETLWSEGDYHGYAHHLKPIKQGGNASLENCVYLRYGQHLSLGHEMAPFGIERQGGSSDTWVQL